MQYSNKRRKKIKKAFQWCCSSFSTPSAVHAGPQLPHTVRWPSVVGCENEWWLRGAIAPVHTEAWVWLIRCDPVADSGFESRLVGCCMDVLDSRNSLTNAACSRPGRSIDAMAWWQQHQNTVLKSLFSRWLSLRNYS